MPYSKHKTDEVKVCFLKSLRYYTFFGAGSKHKILKNRRNPRL